MSQIEKIAELNRLNNLILIKQDRVSKLANRPDQRVRKLMTPSESELVQNYEVNFPNVTTVDDYDALGNPVKKFQRYALPDFEPELEDEPVPPFDITNIEGVKDDLYKQVRGVIEKRQKLLQQKKEAEKAIKTHKNQLDKNEITKEKFQEKMELSERAIMWFNGELNKIDTQIYGLQKQIGEIEYNVSDYEKRLDAVRTENAIKIKTYKDKLLEVNNGSFSMEKNANETEAEYIERLRQNAEFNDPEDELWTAINMTNKQFKLRMKELIKDVAKIEQVTNGLDEFGKIDNKYKLLKGWTFFKNKFMGTYGVDNKRVTADEILTYMRAFLEMAKDGFQSFLKMPVGDSNVDGVSPETVGNNTLKLTNNRIDKNNKVIKTLYLRPLIDVEGKYVLLYSFDGSPTTFTHFVDGASKREGHFTNPTNNKKESSMESIHSRTGITRSNIAKIFGIAETTPKLSGSQLADKLVKEWKLVPLEASSPDVSQTWVDPSSKSSRIQYGFGIHADDIPKVVPFGELFLYLRKLYYENILSIRNKNQKTIAGFNTMKVSEPFVKLITNMLKGLYPTHADLNSLKTGERQVYDRLITLAKLNKSTVTQKDNTVAELKKRLKLLEGEIEIGNNSPLIKKEIYAILHSLRDFKAITTPQITKYMKQIP